MALRLRAFILYAALFLYLLLSFFLFPVDVHAQSGLVMCGFGGDIDTAVNCQFCDLVVLANNIIRYLVMAAISIAAVLFAYAGFLLFSSGGSEERVGKAKTIFKDVVVGMIITLVAFLIVDTLMQTIASGQFTFGGWHRLQCVQGRLIKGSGLGSTQTTTTTGGVNDPGRVDPVVGSGGCSVENMASVYGASAAQNMSCICAKESGGRAQDSTTDRSWVDGQPFSTGLMQVNMVTTPSFSCDPGTGQTTFNCGAAFTADPALLNQCRNFNNTSTRICGSAGWAYRVTDTDLYNRCRAALATPQCNAAASLPLFRNQGYTAWQISARQCGAI